VSQSKTVHNSRIVGLYSTFSNEVKPNRYYAFLRIFTHFKKIVKIREFLRILKPPVTKFSNYGKGLEQA